MDELGYYALWTAEHHFQHEGYEVLPEPHPALAVARHPDAAAQARLRVQRPAHVAPDPPRRGLRDGGHRHRRPRDHGRGPRLSLARGGDASARPCIDQAANRELFEEQVEVHAEVLQRGVVQPPRQALRCPARRGVPRLPAAARSPACRGPKHLPVEIWMPIASSKSIDYMASQGLQGDGHAQRREDPRRRRRGLPRRLRASTAGRSSSART